VRFIPEIGAALILASSDELPESCISAGSDFDEPAEDEEEESDSSVDEFEPRTADEVYPEEDVEEDMELVDQ
jgi:hypothetical protein